MSQILIERRGGTAIRYTGIPLPELARGVRQAANRALAGTFGWWRRVIGPKHFLRQAYGWYGGMEDRVYKFRTPQHERRKMRKQASDMPLVFTGNLRAEFLQGPMVTRVNQSGELKGRAVWPELPKYTYQERGANAPRKHAELTIMNDDDVAKIAAKFGKLLQAELDAETTGTTAQARMDFAA
jgi:hypothetical protein